MCLFLFISCSNPKSTNRNVNMRVNNDESLRIQNLSILVKKIKYFYQVSNCFLQYLLPVVLSEHFFSLSLKVITIRVIYCENSVISLLFINLVRILHHHFHSWRRSPKALVCERCSVSYSEYPAFCSLSTLICVFLN